MVGTGSPGQISMTRLHQKPSYHAVTMSTTTPATTAATSCWERLQCCVFGQTDGMHLFKAIKEGNHENLKMILEKGKTINIQDDKMKTPLHYAASLGKLEIVQLLLEYNANYNAQDSFGNTPLHLALQNDHLDCSMKILECDNLNVNLANEAKDTPLHLAARKGNMEKVGKGNKEKVRKIYMEIVDKLLDVRADYNAVDSSGKTLLHIIAADGHVNCCEKVLQWDDENINAKDNNENTPLHLAAKAGKSDIVALLHNYHADCNLQNSFGDTPLHLAVTGGHFDCFKELMNYDKKEIDLKNNNMCTPLHCAAKTGNSETVRRLLDSNADCNAQDISGNTPLHTAAQMGRRKACDLILQNSDVDINMKNKMQMTPLHLAAQQDNHEVTELLLDKGAKWKWRDRHAYMPLHYAAANGCDKACQLLMEALKKDENFMENLRKDKNSNKLNLRDKKTPLMLAAKGGYHRCCKILYLGNIDAVDDSDCYIINAEDDCGNTALFYAIEANFKKTASFLLEKNANINTKNKDGRTVLHQAAKNKADECLSYILESSNSEDLLFVQDEKDKFTPLHEAIKSQALTCAEILLKHGASLTVTCKDGMTPLHLAAEQGDPGISSLLVTCDDIDVNKENDRQETPLHVAAMHGHRDVCKALMRRGTRMLAADNKGRTALHLAALRGHDQVVTFLMKRGLSPFVKDDDGSTALHLAAAKGHLTNCQILVAKAKRLILEEDKEKKLCVDIAFENKHDEVFAFLIKKLKPSKEISINPSPQSPQYWNKKQNEERRNRFHKYMHQSLKSQNDEDKPRVIAAEAIIESEWWQAAFFPEVNTDTEENDQYCTNFHELVNNHPSLALKAQNNFQCPSGNPELLQDFRLYEDNLCHEAGPKKSINQRALTAGQRLLKEHPVSLMVQQKRSELLQHPLTEAWLLHLWRGYIFYILTFLLIIEVLFLVSLNIFMGNVNDWARKQHKCNTTLLNTTHEQFCSISSLHEKPYAPSGGSEATQNGSSWMIPNDRSGNTSSCYEDPSVSPAWFFLLVMTCTIVFLEGIYIYRLQVEYFKPYRFLRILQVILTIILLLPGVCGFQLSVLYTWQWHCGIFGLLLEWILFIHKLNQLPVLFVFMPVTRYFLWNYIKALGYILLFLFAFSYIFHLLLADHAAFASKSQAMMKMIVWLLGDLNYDDTFVEGHLVHQNETKFIFVAFIFIMGGFIANLAIAQPSDRLDEFRKDAAFFNVAAQSTLFLEIKACFPRFQKVIIRFCRTNETTENTSADKLAKKLFKLNIVTEESMSKDTTLQNLEEQVAALVSLCTEQREELKDMKQQIKILKNMKEQTNILNDMKEQINILLSRVPELNP